MRYPFRDYHLLQLLKRFDQQHLPLDWFTQQYFQEHSALGSKDRQAISEGLYAMIRWKALLDHLIGPNPTWEQRWKLWPHVKPDEFISLPHIPLAIRVSCPDVLLQRLIAKYGEGRAIELAHAMNTPAPITVRVNTLKISRPDLLQLWKEYNVEPCVHSPLGIQFSKRVPMTTLPGWKEGYFDIQDEGSQLVSQLVAAQPGDQVLDYCAGAGGKSLAIALAMQGRGQLYLHDVRRMALEKAKGRFVRAGIQHVQYLTPGHVQLSKLKGKMDWVLVDVPCTGSGTYRRNPDQKWKFSTTMLAELVQKQRHIVQEAIPYLKPGGTLVYATCSLLEEENEQQIQFFVENLPIRSLSTPFSSLPMIGEMDGFFGAVLTPSRY